MRTFLLTVLGTMLIVGCDQSETRVEERSAEVASASSAWPATKKTDGGSFSVTLAPSGGEILNNKHFSLDLSVKPESGAGGSLKLVVDADMPAHGHGMNTQPELVGKGEGQYRVDGMLFHMAGEWVIMVDVTSGTVTERVTFPVLIK